MTIFVTLYPCKDTVMVVRISLLNCEMNLEIKPPLKIISLCGAMNSPTEELSFNDRK